MAYPTQFPSQGFYRSEEPPQKRGRVHLYSDPQTAEVAQRRFSPRSPSDNSPLREKSPQEMNREIIRLANEGGLDEFFEYAEENCRSFDFKNAVTLCYQMQQRIGKTKEDQSFLYTSLFQEQIVPTILKNLRSHPSREFLYFLSLLIKNGIRKQEWFDQLAEEIQTRIGKFKTPHLRYFAWAYAKSGKRNPDLFAAISSEIQKRDFQELTSPELGLLAWAYAKMKIPEKTLFQKISGVVQSRLDSSQNVDSQCISNVLWACASTEFFDKELFAKIQARIEENLGLFTPMDLSQIAWAYAMFQTLAKDPSLDHKDFCTKLVRTTLLEISKLAQRGKALHQKEKEAIGSSLRQVNSALRISHDDIPIEWMPVLPLKEPFPPSTWEEEVEFCLKQLFPHQIIYSREIFHGYYPDFQIQGLRRIIIEVDDNWGHYYVHTRDLLPSTKFRNAVYEKEGYTVISISDSDRWRSMTTEEKLALLKREIDHALRKRGSSFEEWQAKVATSQSSH